MPKLKDCRPKARTYKEAKGLDYTTTIAHTYQYHTYPDTHSTTSLLFSLIMVLARYGDAIIPEDAELLGQSLQMPFSGRVAKSRFFKGATSERLASWHSKDLSTRGVPSDDLVRLYEAWGKAGYGILVTGNVMVDPEELEAPGNAILYEPHETPERIEQFRKMAAAGKAHGSLMIMQVSHGHQLAVLMGSSAVGSGASDTQPADRIGSFRKPTVLDKAGIRKVVDQFAYTAEAAYRAGFDGIQLHWAHGYLIDQSLSQTTNNRTEDYGGSIKNRSRFIKELINAIRAKVPDRKFVIGMKVNSVEFQAKGLQACLFPEEAAELCEQLEALEIDFVELSGGTYEKKALMHSDSGARESTLKREAFFAEFTQQVAPWINRAVVYITGGFRSASGMAKAIRDGACAGVGLGRPAASDLALPNEIIQKGVTGATKINFSSDDFTLSILAAQLQMLELVQGRPVIDLSDPQEVARFQEFVPQYLQEQTQKLEEGLYNPRIVHGSLPTRARNSVEL
ncbi:Artemisinic aldehyde Delta(11(13)) reductase OS=Artemisia annua GN=DBR2 PE=1 SV=1 [Rhizoctonia solani AG-1 IB]|uniref:Artemisinic aldehyde Delta(11(13)) reductase n=1 Tax=Thanatephorus cucumeris (strain AG1-IB / isolate 7/3/14) TaxID=1108050 RepID=A0A0B7F8X5_THACB|nr:Artemisinic aldehyde Delta(11(13)) reductase OS=Artemisia annua GN=DBR2 PE=1 SV=1 [Rhizoctonia solani AG-1 IB]